MSDIKWSDKRASDPTDPLDGTEILVVVQGGVSKGGIISDIRDWILSKLGVWTKNQSVAPVTLTSSASIATDASASNNFYLLLAHTGTLNNPSNATDGMILNYTILIDGTGGRVLTLGSDFVAYDNSPVLLSTANAVNLLSCQYIGSLSKWYYNISTKA